MSPVQKDQLEEAFRCRQAMREHIGGSGELDCMELARCVRAIREIARMCQIPVYTFSDLPGLIRPLVLPKVTSVGDCACPTTAHQLREHQLALGTLFSAIFATHQADYPPNCHTLSDNVESALVELARHTHIGREVYIEELEAQIEDLVSTITSIQNALQKLQGE